MHGGGRATPHPLTRILVAATLCVACGPSTQALADPSGQTLSHVEAAQYLNDGASFMVGCDPGALPFTVGGVCLAPLADDLSVTVTVNDDLTQRVTAELAYF